jgi:hypothetical protein
MPLKDSRMASEPPKVDGHRHSSSRPQKPLLEVLGGAQLFFGGLRDLAILGRRCPRISLTPAPVHRRPPGGRRVPKGVESCPYGHRGRPVPCGTLFGTRRTFAGRGSGSGQSHRRRGEAPRGERGLPAAFLGAGVSRPDTTPLAIFAAGGGSVPTLPGLAIGAPQARDESGASPAPPRRRGTAREQAIPLAYGARAVDYASNLTDLGFVRAP